MMSSGGLVIMDSATCMVEVARFFMGFAQSGSCSSASVPRGLTACSSCWRRSWGHGSYGDLNLWRLWQVW